MGLHIQTCQTFTEAEITVQGQLTGHAIRQLEAAMAHFHSRGCKTIRVNVKQIPGISDVAAMLATIGITDVSTEFAIR